MTHDESFQSLTDHELAEAMRARACPAGLPHTGDDPASDHGHTDCWLFHLAADRLDPKES